MSYQPLRSGLDLRRGLIGGIGANLVGFVCIWLVVLTGLHPDRGIWTYTETFALIDNILLYGSIHLPAYGGVMRGELFAYTVLVFYILAGAGFLASWQARKAGSGGGFKTGASIAVGYLLAVLLQVGYLVFVFDSLTFGQIMTPLILVGFVLPAVFGGIGGAISELV
jgi:hypothetical protein